MFLIKLAAIAAFIVCLLVICMLVKAIADQQKQMLVLKRKNAALTLEMNQREDIRSCHEEMICAMYEEGVM